MNNWLNLVAGLEALEDLVWDAALVRGLEQDSLTSAQPARVLHLYTPSFKKYSSTELPTCGKQAWPAISITGGDCALACDHCKAKILEPMLAARTPQALWQIVNEQIAAGARGMLLSGGSNRRNEVEYYPYFPILRRIKNRFPDFKIALHSALADLSTARRMQDAGVDTAMMDLIGAQDTITQVYHLKRGVDDFERTLEYLLSTSMRVVPHIVLGLHYGKLLGEWRALEIIQKHKPHAVVLVVVMPFYATPQRPYATPDAHEIGRFFRTARAALPNIPILLGCARPAGKTKLLIDAYAVMAGLDGIAHPAEGMVALAKRLHRDVKLSATCCSMTMDSEILGQVNGSDLLEAPNMKRSPATALNKLSDIAVVLR